MTPRAAGSQIPLHLEAPARLRVEIQGAVQGVGFRPGVYRLATELELAGWVLNDSRGVTIEVEGTRATLETFLSRLPAEAPPLALLHSVVPTWLAATGCEDFTIRHSKEQGAKTVFVLPDVATCDDCLREVLDPRDRRFGYPFTNCTNCGPRFSIIEALPYDRPHTTMRRFAMCPDCAREYGDPRDRRFHAQPNACPVCGPRLEVWSPAGERLEAGGAALQWATEALREGDVLALKGLGGFHLMVDAGNREAVARLRRRKARWEKPLALMVPDLDAARLLCEVPRAAARLLASEQRPIVLLRRRPHAPVVDEVAPGNPCLGLMLPYTPLHHLLLQRFGEPLVATSGNLSDEPISIDNHEALARLGGIADLFLVHDRPIARQVDDSVFHLIRARPQPLRRSRGFAPLPVLLDRPGPTVLAVGGHLKSSVALAVGDKAFLSQHIGDMETPEARAAFARVIADFLRLYEAVPQAIAHDLHPDYPSTRWALEQEVDAAPRSAGGEAGAPDTTLPAAAVAALRQAPRVAVQHHHAHLAACLAEHRVAGPALGVIWDGTGYGGDGTVWGGEFLLGDAAGFERVGHLRPFRLPGGDAAVMEPRRVALALLWEMYGEAALGRDDLPAVRALGDAERRTLGRMLERGLRSPVTTSAGRLFDAVAALFGVRQSASYEGQAAMELEWVADRSQRGFYPVTLRREPGADGRGVLVLDWAPLVEALLDDRRRGIELATVAGRFHNALVSGIVALARSVGTPRVALSGGCFQNRTLSERAAHELRRSGFEVLLHQHVPPNDGGLALGQLAVAAARLATGTAQPAAVEQPAKEDPPCV